MKTNMKTNFCLRSAAILLTLVFARLAAAQTQVPFSGSLQGQETDTTQGNPPQQILVDGTVKGFGGGFIEGQTGAAIRVGRFTLHYKVTVSLPAGSSTGSAELTAKNGDMITTTIVGQGEPVAGIPGLNRIVEINTITGGTGRFAGATGGFTVERLVQLSSQPAPTSGSFHGAITLPGGSAQ
jgi:hypothetical protein